MTTVTVKMKAQPLCVRPDPGLYVLFQSSQHPYEVDVVISPILQMKKQRQRKVK